MFFDNRRNNTASRIIALQLNNLKEEDTVQYPTMGVNRDWVYHARVYHWFHTTKIKTPPRLTHGENTLSFAPLTITPLFYG